MPIKCIIVDDEPLARKVIKNLLQSFKNIELVGECKNAIQALEVLNSERVDLIFLDIRMPQVTGIDFLKSVVNPPDIIITTAYRDYAVESFDLNVIDYLLKPISLDRFLKAINKFYLKRSNSTSNSSDKIENLVEGDFIYVKENKKTNKIFLSDILLLESQKEYVKITTHYGIITTKASLSRFEENLPDSLFIRIHNSYIISINQIRSFSTTKVEIASGHELPISRSYRKNVMNRLELNG